MTDDTIKQPILPGDGASDYERYLRTDELLLLQKPPSEQVHRDELLFQVTHQASELWLKLAATEASAAVELMLDEPEDALRLLRRASLALRFVTGQLDMLEEMSPWEYQEIRKVLGHGSGFDSPGFRALRRALPPLQREFSKLCEAEGLALVDVYVDRKAHVCAYRLAEALVELDECVQTWRIRHYRVVARVIGDKVVGTQGTPVEVLGRLVQHVTYPELWEIRNELTALSKTED